MESADYLLSFVSYRVVATCLASVPLTHCLGLYWHCPKRLPMQHYLLFPFTGGNRHVIFQLLGWGLWALSSLSILPVMLTFLSRPLPIIPHTHVDVVSGASAACSFIGELFMLKALLVYDVKDPEASGAYKRQFASPAVASAAVVVMGLLLSMTGLLLLLALEYMPDIPSRVLYCCLSLSCLLIAASSTYGLGGFLRFGRPAASQRAEAMAAAAAAVAAAALPPGPCKGGDVQPGWQFFQPFSGGTAFIATQAVGWSMFAGSVTCLLLLLGQVMAGVVSALRWWIISAGAMMFATQVVLALSLLMFRGSGSATKRVLRPLAGGRTLLQRHAPILLMYLPVHTFFVLWVASFTFAPLDWAVAGWVAFLLPYYIITTQGEPQNTGCRRWEWLCDWFTSHLEASLEAWAGELKVLRHGSAAFPPEKKYVFGFHPHGLYPTGAGFLPLMPSFRALIPGVSPVTLTASALYLPPFIKDICCWAGFRQVGRTSFSRALREKGAVILCPGGQAELVHAYRAHRSPREFVLYTRHRGFIRLALEQRAAIVPVLALGEVLQLRNAFDMPSLQQYTYRRLGFPVPYMMVGRWGVSPFPQNAPLHYIVGDPIHPPEDLPPGETASEEVVEDMRKRFVACLVAMFDAHSANHALLRDSKLVLIDD